MEALITKAIRTISTGCGLDDKTEVFVLKGDVWELSATFYQSDDNMSSKLRQHLQYLKDQEFLTQSSSTFPQPKQT